MVSKEEKRKKDEELFFEAIEQYATNDTDKPLILAAMKAIFNNMDDLDMGVKND